MSGELRQSEDHPKHILFVGAGAVGCFYASRLHHPANNVFVSLVCRSNFSTIARSGVQLKTRTFGDYHFSPAAVYSSIADAASSKTAPKNGWDYVVVTTKALPDKVNDAKEIEPVVRKRADGNSCIVLIQNGVGFEAAHRKLFPRNPLVSAVTIISAEQISHGVVQQNKWTRISIGPFSDGQGGRTPEAKQLAERGRQSVSELSDLWTRLGKIRDVESCDEIGLQEVRWHKICINAAFNPSAVLSGGRSNASMALDPELHAHIKGCMDEVFEAAPYILGRPFASKLAKPELILKSTARNPDGRPSMLVDWEHGRPMELEVILGNPVRIAKERGFEMKRLQTVYALLKSQQIMREAEKGKAKGDTKL